MWHYFDIGGPLMYPLLLCSVVGSGVAIERAIFFLLKDRNEAVTAEKISQLIQNGNTAGALDLARSTEGPVAAVLAEGLSYEGKSREMIDEVISRKGSAELNSFERHLDILELIARIAPLLGLLGTVLGLVEAFRSVAGAAGPINPAMLAGGIWEALLTTVFGLFIAIPCMVVYHIFDKRIRSMSWLMRHHGSGVSQYMGAVND